MQEPSTQSSSQAQAQDSLLAAVCARVAGFIRDKDLIGGDDHVLCMVSGGADSVAMLRLLAALSQDKAAAPTGGFSLGICHVNYGRRGKDSNGDEAFVRGLGDELGLPVHVIRAPAGQRSNFQAWARDFRYLAAQNLCRSHAYTRIAVGHNMDDRVETFIYRMITYSGRRSLVVMPPRRGHVIRPLLLLKAEEIRDYCAGSGFAWREDESNQSPDYTRNRIRLSVLPRLEELRADFRERIIDTLALLEDEDEVLSAVTEDAWRGALGSLDGRDCLKASSVSRMPRATARLVVRRWLAGAGRQVRISRRLLDAIVDLCADSSGTVSLTLADGLQVERQYDKLLLVATAPASMPPDLAILPVPGKTVFGDYLVEAVEAPGWGLSSADPSRVTLDGDLLNEILTVRSWLPGDRFTPLGLQGIKSIQDLFTDEKVPRGERTHTPIVESGGKIVWVCGIRMAEAFKVTDTSGRLVGLRFSRRRD